MKAPDTQAHIGNIQEDRRERHNPFSARSQRNAILDFCSLGGWNKVVAVTLTFRQSRSVSVTHEQWSGTGNRLGRFHPTVIERLDQDKCFQNLRHFMNVLNSKVFGMRFKRHGKRLRFIPVIEGGRDKRLHCHAAIECPKHLDHEEFQMLVREIWEKTYWGYHEVELVAESDFGWLDYMMKLRDKEHYDLSIDWLNFYNP